jgi:hypothetical protein
MDLPLDCVLSIIDFFLLEGYPALIRSAITILKLLEPKIIEARSIESIMEMLKSPTSYFNHNRESFMKIASSYKITK